MLRKFFSYLGVLTLISAAQTTEAAKKTEINFCNTQIEVQWPDPFPVSERVAEFPWSQISGKWIMIPTKGSAKNLRILEIDAPEMSEGDKFASVRGFEAWTNRDLGYSIGREHLKMLVIPICSVLPSGKQTSEILSDHFLAIHRSGNGEYLLANTPPQMMARLVNRADYKVEGTYSLWPLKTEPANLYCPDKNDN